MGIPTVAVLINAKLKSNDWNEKNRDEVWMRRFSKLFPY